MDTSTITAGTLVEARTAFGNLVRRRALGVPEMRDFVVVRLVTEEDWERAQSGDGDEIVGVPWPVEDVCPVDA